MKTNKTILVVGSIAIDSLNLPSGKHSNLLGGSASYFAIAAGLLSSVKIVGVVGTDFPDEAKNLLLSKKINIDNLVFASGKTFRWGGEYSNTFETRTTLFTELGVFESFVPQIKFEDRSSPFLFLGNIQPSLQLEVLDLMVGPKITVSDTMNLWIDTCSKQLHKVINKSDIFLLNHEEAEQLTGTKDIEASAKIILDMGPKTVIIKMGADGAYIKNDLNTTYVPSFPVKKVIDPTGAGDSFAGGLLAHLSTTNSIKIIEAVIMGSAMASFCVEGAGLEGLLLSKESELYSRIEKIKSLL
tara:strand:- start:101 stop:997 length:897 start_codon:yes stop_codon:yes gene_type:complete